MKERVWNWMSEVVEKILEKFEKEICVQTLLYEKIYF